MSPSSKAWWPKNASAHGACTWWSLAGLSSPRKRKSRPVLRTKTLSWMNKICPSSLKEDWAPCPFVKEGVTKPPRLHTESSILGMMETAGKWVNDDAAKEALKGRGLGTPATRAAIIETLLRRSYIARKGKELHITDLGLYLIALIQDPILKSPEMTGDWEHRCQRSRTRSSRRGRVHDTSQSFHSRFD